ncbi:MAG: anthranilate synthase component 2 [Planctomycetota bacterium]|jgi:anthranilate synthase component 2
MSILMIDNYDSFTYNLVQYLGELGAEVEVVRNDQIDVEQLMLNPATHIMVSPGPGTPDQAGISMAAIAAVAGDKPLFGVCLGHQSIGQVFGGKIIHARKIMHGKTSLVHHLGTGVFAGLANPFTATRYHSLVIEKESLPDCLEITAWTENDDGEIDEIMAIKHKELAVEGVQFHPESILSEHGHAMLNNFLQQNINS